ncbi:MAG TPA: di-heme enzyme [Kofleriaceae bacterium]|nr:di-heme enzyme [Kofleriaceae bacterium]
MRASLLVLLVACGAPAETDTWQWNLPRSFPTPVVPTDNPMTTSKVELGRTLFFDTRLSINGTQACASCHDPARAFTDGRVTPLGATGEPGIHNAMSLVNVAYNSSNTWAHDVGRLEDQARLPMFGTAPVEMGLAGTETDLLARLHDDYGDAFTEAFDDGLTVANITRAIACFERTIISGDSRFDRFIAGDTTALDASEQRGLALFESDRLGCTHCHAGFNLASSFAHEGASEVRFFNTGLYDVDGQGAYPAGDRGLIEITSVATDMGRFRAPTLRNIALTAPYFHDGSASTLDAVIDHYAQGGVHSPLQSPFITGFTLTAPERVDLIAFLGALTDDTIATNPAFVR